MHSIKASISKKKIYKTVHRMQQNVFFRHRSSEVTSEDWPFIRYALFAEEDYDDSYYDHSEFDISSFDYLNFMDNSTFNYTEFARRTGFLLDSTTLLDCKFRGRACNAKVFCSQKSVSSFLQF